ncbi:MAG: HypC/HybG/HupF family hydrogenase formation chaperone [Planctomycetota bacterium]
MCLAVPGLILEIEEVDPQLRSGRVQFGGITREINLALVPEAEMGDYVLVHAGVALTKVDEEEARQTFEYLRQIGELSELEPEGEA